MKSRSCAGRAVLLAVQREFAKPALTAWTVSVDSTISPPDQDFEEPLKNPAMPRATGRHDRVVGDRKDRR